MVEVLGLTLPLFGLILLGFMGGKISNQPLDALGWLNTFIIYFALPALFFKLLSTTPIDQLANWQFVFANIGITFLIFSLTFLFGMLGTRGNIGESTIQGLAGAYGNIGYMGPAVAILALGEKAAIPVAIIFCFENIMHFAIAPAMMAISGEEQKKPLALLLDIVRKIVLHPFILATIAGVAAAAVQFSAPIPVERLIDYLAQAAAPCALFAMGVTLALRQMNRIPYSLGYIVPIKLILHPLLMYVGLSWAGNFDPTWMYVAVLLASLPVATNVFVIAQQYNVWVERASASIMITTAASVLTVSSLLFLLTTGQLEPDLFP
ncbi:MAG: AEC family transporter [Rhizobiaceae bacterium]|nr:AEC family transporter [Rhizobiaceae bacterium]